VSVSPAVRLKIALVGLNSPGYRSLALGYVRAYAQSDPRLGGVAYTTLDLDTTVDPWWVAYRTLALEPDVVGLWVVCWNARAVYEVARVIAGARPGTTIVLGGPEVGPIAEDVLAANPAVTAVVRGEGELTFADVLDSIARGRDDLTRIEGVTARRAGRIASAPDRAPVADLDSLPSPYLSGALEPAEGATYLEGYRGCPHRCGYCYEGKGTSRIRSFSDERIAAEIEFVASRVRTFSFIDPVFNLTRERLQRMSDLLAPHEATGTRLHTVEVDIERVDAEEAALLVRAGVRSVETGPQSVGSQALEACRRSFDADRHRAGIEACRAAGISVESDLIVGLPGDTTRDVLAGIDFAISCDPGTVQMSTLHVLPGTDLWTRADELGLAFDREPPHELVATGDIAFADLRRLEVLGSAATAIYRARLPKGTHT
jgi:radical SAM superfamily enzyme YgiQ (UPF0313 family)